MLRILLLLFDLLTDDNQIAVLAHHLFLFGMVNTGIFCFFGSLWVFRRCKFRRNHGSQRALRTLNKLRRPSK